MPARSPFRADVHLFEAEKLRTSNESMRLRLVGGASHEPAVVERQKGSASSAMRGVHEDDGGGAHTCDKKSGEDGAP